MAVLRCALAEKLDRSCVNPGLKFSEKCSAVYLPIMSILKLVLNFIDICSHTQHTLLLSFIIWKLVSTPNMGHHHDKIRIL